MVTIEYFDCSRQKKTLRRGLECCGKAEFIRNRPTQLDLATTEPEDSPHSLLTTTVDCTALTNSGYWTMCTCYTCIVIHQAIAVQSQLCAPFIDRSHAASICASLRGCWILLWRLALRPDSRSATHHNSNSTPSTKNINAKFS